MTDGERPLEIEGLSVRFGGTVALADVTLHVDPAEQVGLIGPNGAGKTTLLGAVSGFVRPSRGRIVRHGHEVSSMSAERRARRGLGRTFQHSSRFSALTAVESVAVAVLAHREGHPFWRGLIGRGRVLDQAMDEARGLLGELGVESHADAAAGELPLGIARLVDVARAICGRPDLLLLDEPSSGLDEREREHLQQFLRRHVGERGIAFLLVEHDVAFVQALCDRIVVLDFGRKIADGPTAEVLADPKVRAAYLGQQSTEDAIDEETLGLGDRGEAVAPERPAGTPPVAARPASPASADPAGGPDGHAAAAPGIALELRDVAAGYGRSLAISGVTLTVTAGRVTAVLGPNGAGKTTLARVVTGQVAPLSGQVLLDDADVTGESAATTARRGVFSVPDERAVYPSLNVRENLRMAFRHRVPKSEVDERIDQVVELFPPLARHLGTRAGTLSGGEQQMLAIAPAIAVPPALLVVDELSHGLSPLIVGQMFAILAGLKGQVTMLVIEQFTDRALALADNVVALRRGRVVFDDTAASVTPEDIVSWYALDGQDEAARISAP